MKTIRLIATTIAAVGAAVAVLIGLCNWAKLQNISWMTLLSTLFVTLIAFLLVYFIIIDPLKKKNKNIEDKIDSSLKGLKEITQDIFNAVRELQQNSGSECVHTLSPKASSDWAMAGSPLKLNVSGKILLEKSGIDKIIDVNIEKLILMLEGLTLNTAYDVQTKSFSILGDFILETAEFEKKIKNFVFNNPTVENRNIGFSDVIFVGSLLLRDEYLKKHPELK
jgi:hypothetical protein